jgi:dihydroorotase
MGAVAFKLYPAGATTNSDAGVTDLRKCHTRRSKRCSAKACCCCVHGEVTDSEIDVFDREKAFIDRQADPFAQAIFPS